MGGTPARTVAAPPPWVRPRPNPRLRLFVAAVTVVAVAATASAVRGAASPTAEQALTAVLLAGMVGVAHAFPVQLAPRVQISADTAPAFAAVLLLPPPLTLAVSALGIGAGEVWRRVAGIQFAYNVSVSVLRAAAAAATLALLAPAPRPMLPDGWRSALAAGAAALAMYGVNVGLIDAIVAVQRRVNPLRGWFARHRGQLPQEGTLYLLGVVVAGVGERWPLALLLLAAPSFVVYRSLRDGVAVRVQNHRTLEELADMIDRSHPFFANHGRRSAEVARALAEHLGLPRVEVETVAVAARLQNVGLVAVRAGVLARGGLVSPAEWEEIRRHPEAGAQLLAGFAELGAVVAIVCAHHERWDGRGYPRGLRGEQIPLGARLVAVADAYVAMTSDRPYRPALPLELVRRELRAGAGTQFDPRIAHALVDLLVAEPRLGLPAAVPAADTGPGG
jgi:HD-GYP domain-containing protein (c-di-GMP phosphodiesterase class II)